MLILCSLQLGFFLFWPIRSKVCTCLKAYMPIYSSHVWRTSLCLCLYRGRVLKETDIGSKRWHPHQQWLLLMRKMKRQSSWETIYRLLIPLETTARFLYIFSVYEFFILSSIYFNLMPNSETSQRHTKLRQLIRPSLTQRLDCWSFWHYHVKDEKDEARKTSQIGRKCFKCQAGLCSQNFERLWSG